MTSSPPKHFIFLLLPNFTLLGLSSAVEVLRVANRKSNSTLYSWELVSKDGGLFASSGGIEMNTISMDKAAVNIHETPNFRFVICGGEGAEDLTDPKTLSWVRETTRFAEYAGAISDGSYLAAAAGIFEGYRSTIHWQCHDGYVEKYPNQYITRKIFEIDRNRFSCAGGVAAYDLFLALVDQEQDHYLSTDIAENSVLSNIRGQDSHQRLKPAYKYGTSSRHLIKVIESMETNLEHPISITKLAEQQNLSARQLSRIFIAEIGKTPAQFYMSLRIRRAASLLRQTTLSIDEISAACGFSSGSHLSKNFRQIWNLSPQVYRKQKMS